MLLKNKSRIILILLVLFIGTIIRFYQLGKVPNGLMVDEADTGYNAYSILRTGKDIYGRKFPLYFQSFDDYKPGIPFYFSVPAVYLFGLSDFSVRLTPALIGSITPFLAFMLVFLLYPRNFNFAILTAVLYIFAPWNIAISRGALWYSETVFFIFLYIIFFLFGVKKNSGFLIVSAVIASLSLYLYHSFIIYIPLTLIVLYMIYKKKLLSNLKVTFVSILLFIVIATPAFLNYQSESGRSRFKSLSIFTAEVTLPVSISEMEYDIDSSYLLAPIVHNRRFIYLNTALSNYFDNLNLSYLFINANDARYFYVNNVGLFYIIELPLFLLGIFTLIRKRGKSDLLILSFLIIGPLSAILTLGAPSPHRALLFLLGSQIVVGMGTVELITFLLQKKIKYLWVLVSILIISYLANAGFFLHQYFIHNPQEFTSENDNGAWFSTVRDAIPKVNQYKNKYDKIVFTWSSQKLVPAVYFLFYNQIDPKILQQKAALWTNEPPSYKQIYNQIENIEFRPIFWEQDKNLNNTLFIGYKEEFPEDVKIIDNTYLPNGKEHFLLVENP